MRFKNFDLFFENDKPTQTDFARLFNKGIFRKTYGEVLYEFKTSFDGDRFFTIACDYDNFLHRDKVYDVEKEEENENPRKPSQNELRQQVFVCYDLDTSTLYLSDFQKKNTIQHYMEESTQKQVRIRERISSIDEFELVIKYLKRIRFVQRNTLMNTASSTIFQRQMDYLGLDVPEYLTMKLDYGNLDIGKCIQKIRALGNRRAQGEFSDIIIVGEDAFGIEKSFNFASMITNTEVNINTDENGRYDADEVLKSLIAIIGR